MGIGHWSARQVILGVVVACIAVGYGAWVASTVPFTTGSDVAVACGLAAMAVVAGGALRGRARGEYRPALASPPARLAHWFLPAAVLTGFELGTYLAGQSERRAWPTISSLYDSAAASHPAKAAIVVVWIAIGWFLFRR